MTDIATINVGNEPLAIAVSETGPEAGDLYVANEAGDTVSVIDPSTNTVVATIGVGSAPYAIAVSETGPDAGDVYVANFGSGTVSMIDPSTNTVIDTISVGSYPLAIAVSETGPEAGDVYVANAASGTVSVIDPSTNTVVANISVRGQPGAIVVSETGPEAGDVCVANFESNTVAVIDPSTNTVIDTISVGSQPSGIALSDAGNVYVANPESDTVLEFSALCFCVGTAIATPAGEVAVEDLRAGDLVLAADGRRLPIRWIGQSHVAKAFADPLRAYPIRIRAGALGENLPKRDLRVSPEHAIFIADILVQAAALVDGVTVLREHSVPDHFTYYHLELATHELLLAEGVLAESFVDNMDRMHFHNWDARTAPDQPIAELPYPRAKSARQVPARIRRQSPLRCSAMST